MDTIRNPQTIVVAKLAFTKDSKANKYYLNARKKINGKGFGNYKTTNKKLQAKTQKLSFKQFYLKELQVAIYGEVKALGETMMNLYEELAIMHKLVVPFHDKQKKLWENAKALKSFTQPLPRFMNGE